MEITFLTKENIRPYLDYLKDALAEEPDMMWVDEIDEEAILKNLPHTTSMVAVEEEKSWAAWNTTSTPAFRTATAWPM